MDNPPDKQLNIFISPEMTAELKEAARRETELLKKFGIGRKPITKSGLAFEIFEWAFDVYREVGTLTKLKALHLTGIDLSQEVSNELTLPSKLGKSASKTKHKTS